MFSIAARGSEHMGPRGVQDGAAQKDNEPGAPPLLSRDRFEPAMEAPTAMFDSDERLDGDSGWRLAAAAPTKVVVPLPHARMLCWGWGSGCDMRWHAQPVCGMTLCGACAPPSCRTALRGTCELPGCEIGCDGSTFYGCSGPEQPKKVDPSQPVEPWVRVTAGPRTLHQVEAPCGRKSSHHVNPFPQKSQSLPP